MTIATPNHDSIQIKTKNGTICLGNKVSVGDFELQGPGEYEIGGIEIFGVGKLFIFEVEEMRLAYLDKMNRLLNDGEIEVATDVDILFVPIGGGEVLDVKKALTIINQLEPKIVIPLHYEDIDEFTKEEGIKPEFVDSLKVGKQDLSETERKVYVLPWKQSKIS